MVQEVCSRPGLWVRSGQSAAVTGLDWPTVESMRPASIARETWRHLAGCFEHGLIVGSAELMKDAADKAKR